MTGGTTSVAHYTLVSRTQDEKTHDLVRVSKLQLGSPCTAALTIVTS